MEPIDYLRVIRLRWQIIAAVVLVGVAAAWLTAPAGRNVRAVDKFKASHTLVLDPNSDRVPGEKTLEQIALLVTVGDVPTRAARAIRYDGDPAVLATEVVATANPDLQTVVIESTQQDGPRAARVANAFATALLDFLAEESRSSHQRSLDAVAEQIESLRTRIVDLDAELARDPDDEIVRAQRDALVRQYSLVYEQYQQLAAEGVPSAGLLTLQRATPVPVSEGGFRAPDSRPQRALLAGLLGLVVGVGAAFAIDRLDTRIRSKEDAERAFGLPVLVEVPRFPRSWRHGHDIVTVNHPLSPAAEAFRVLRTSLRLAPTSSNGNGHAHSREAAGSPGTVLVTSTNPSEGKTTTVANLAATFAELGSSVLVVSGDLRHPDLDQYFDVSPTPGIADLTLGHRPPFTVDTWSLRRLFVPTRVPRVRALPSGATSVTTGTHVGLEREVVESARRASEADVVLVDSPPLLIANDAAELARSVDAVVLVCRAGAVRTEDAARVADRLSRLGAPAVGVVLVAPSAAHHRTARYGYYTASTRQHALRRWWRRWVWTGEPVKPAPEPVSEAPPEADEPAPAPTGTFWPGP